MDIFSIAFIVIGCLAVLAVIILGKMNKPKNNNRPGINIDFDTAKEREDKNRYFS